MRDKWDIWRTYNGKIDISWAVEDIHSFLFSKNSISSRTKNDANLLTRFFKEIKRLSIHNTDEKVEKQLKKELISDELKGRFRELNLDFTKGGKSIGGTDFEKEILKLLEDVFTGTKYDNFISGQNKSAVYIKQSQKATDPKVAAAIIEDILGDVEGHFKIFNSKVKKELKVLNDIEDFPVRITKKVDGKIDLKASSKAELDVELAATASPELLKALNLIKNSSFSIKSYASSNPFVELGSTSAEKAVSAVSEYVAEKTGNHYVNYAATFYRAHEKRFLKLENRKRNGKTVQKLNEIYNHYNHMRNVYELTGIGLRINELEDLYNVDFLLFNRANSNEIKVYAVNDLIKRWDIAGSNKNNIRSTNRYRNRWKIDI